MYKEVVLTLCLLVALASRAQATDGHPIYGVKLCGREFIRAVIFTCGGSRWRRSVSMAADLSTDLLSAHDDEASDDWSSNSLSALSYKPHPDSETPGWAPEGPEGPVFPRPARSLISDEVLEALRTSDRKGRDVVVGLSNACCKWGCSKSEISSLC
ncbi:relaxin-3b [Hoplias malabaricus]|uniref:relaxin-3b n=1 Tax=Hoplias malabaricus TaxID=27720 RepID=UPI0034629661